MTTLPEIAAEARRMAASYRDNVIETMPETWSFARAADDFDRLAEMAEPKGTAKERAAT